MPLAAAAETCCRHEPWRSRAAAFSAAGREMPENAIFISYAREDLAAVQRLKASFDAAGLITWFDLDRLEGGDDYDRKIHANIARCSFFLPVISAATQRRHEAYFRREWSYAVDRSRNIAEGAVFILPVCIDAHVRSRGARSRPVQGRAHHTPAEWRAFARVHRPVAGTLQRAPLMKAPELSTAITIDPENPWLGLSSYSEETRAYFHGRDEEAAELARRVQRKLLTVLFGQSGLGKTSLLRAGLVPRLRGEAFCPVYVRIDYSADSPTPSEQIKQAIFKATADAGHWTRPGSAIEGESLWEFLHHRGDLLRDVSGRTVLPLLIFDQFEEIFTLAQADDTGRLRAKLFLQDLADLVENRPPAALETRIDNDEADAGDFDFSRADYRILIALREDYLAHLESVKTIMPSITQNRMRLARMNGAQALSAVVKPGGRLVTEEVAESIVRFVAGGSEIANAEVEPSLLSLICRELNTVRQAQGRDEISADLLAGSRDTILSEFYERALADQPAGVRRVVEDELLTESGYRESLAEERVAKALAAAGAAPDALATLVDRRLLRVEDRLDMRRVELTHDVLCSVVRSSRDMRHQREARDEARRQLAAQEAREEETHRTLMRTRMVAMVAGVLMVIAGASAVFGWVNLDRARAADAETRHANALAEKARGDAEKLVGFLIEDFYAELEPTGRLETMGKLAHMAVSYYDGLARGTDDDADADLPRHGADPRGRFARVARELCRGKQIAG